MYAVIKTGGKQYRVKEGDVITVEKLDVEAGQKITFEEVLSMGDGADLEIGTPFIAGAKVFGEVVENGKGKKVIIFKYKAKKDYRKKQGHRQPYTMVQITGIGQDNGKAAAPKADAPAPSSLNAMKKDELIAYAAEKNIEIDAKATKAVIIEAIQAAQ